MNDKIELRDPDLDAATAAVVALAAHGVPVDIQELLVRGNAALSVRPGALLAATKATITSYRASEEATRRANCRHPNKRGSGSLGSDGSSTWDWYCPDCGASDKGSTPARIDPQPIFAVKNGDQS